MSFLRRFVWWKCLFWIALGCGLGAAIASLRAEIGPPAGGTRVATQDLVVGLTAGDTPADAITGVVVYPPHRDVQLVTFDYRKDGKASAGYAFANAPLLKARELQNDIKAQENQLAYAARREAAAAKRSSPSILSRLFGGRPAPPTLSPPNVEPTPELKRLMQAADFTAAQPGHQWGSATAFFDALRAKRPAFVYTQAWWTGDGWRWGVPMAAGAVIVGLLGSILTRRSAADMAAADLLAGTRVQTSVAPTPSANRDLSAVAALDAVLEARLAGDLPADGTVLITPTEAAGEAAPRRLETGPLVALPAEEKEQKDYAGEFYPTVRRATPKAFSLVELLVSIGVIAILIGLLLPAIIGARRSADTVACASNLRSIGQGMAVYLLANQDTYPPAYLYIGHRIENGVQTPTSMAAGYIHWSSYLYGTGGVGKNAFMCPAMRQGGLPPTNTPPENRDPGQNCPSQTVVDEQAPRLAYTVNEVLCPRNKFVARSFGGSRVYRFVKASEVANSSGTILGTEMIDNAAAISYGDAEEGFITSHRPLSGYVGLDGTLDMYLLPVGAQFRGATAADLDADPNSVGDATKTRLDLVGRNHGKKAGYPDRRLSNFLYVDGHVETKSVYDTVTPAFEWGAKFYSLTPNDDQVSAGAG